MNLISFCIAVVIKIVTCNACESCINTDSLVLRDTKFDGNQIWSARVSDVGACAKACLRLKLCASFNYDILSRNCDLYSDSAGLEPHNVSHGVGSLYSAIAGWPETLDADCFGRPYADDDVCIPGAIAQRIDAHCLEHNCTYTCLKFRQTRNTTVSTVTPSISTTTSEPLTSTTTEISVAYLCPSSWILFDTSCYRYVSSLRTWSAALSYCRSIGSHIGTQRIPMDIPQRTVLITGSSLSQNGMMLRAQWRFPPCVNSQLFHQCRMAIHWKMIDSIPAACYDHAVYPFNISEDCGSFLFDFKYM